MDAESRLDLVSLLRAQRWAALATLCADGAPLASSVAYALAPDASGFLLHLSRLAEHTRNLLARPRASLVIGEADNAAGDPQTLSRVSIQGQVELLSAEAPAYSSFRSAYIARLPSAAPRFDLSDFALFRLAPSRAKYVGGFARAFSLDAAAVEAVLNKCLDS